MSFTKISSASIASSLVAAALFSLSPAGAQGYGNPPPAPPQVQAQAPVCPPGFVLYQAPLQPGQTDLPPPTCYQPQPQSAPVAPVRASYGPPATPVHVGGGYAPRPYYGPPPRAAVPFGPVIVIKEVTNPITDPGKKTEPTTNPVPGKGHVVCFRAPCNVNVNPTPTTNPVPSKGHGACFRAPCNINVNKGLVSPNPNAKFTGFNPTTRHPFHVKPAGFQPSRFQPRGFQVGGFQHRPAMAARQHAAPRAGSGGGLRFAGRR